MNGEAKVISVPDQYWVHLPERLAAVLAADCRVRPQIWLAGGGALRVLLGKDNAGVWKGDWDLFCSRAGFELLKGTGGLNFAPEQHPWSNCYDLYREHGEEWHVFVANHFEYPAEVYRFFDLSVSKVAFNAACVSVHPQALQDLQEGSVRYVVPREKWLEERMEKYVARGFRRAVPIFS